MTTETVAIRTLAPAPVAIQPATDLTGVQTLKHGNLYLLTDAFGDIHPDARGLGLYDLDTRILSCAVLRLNGIRPTLLRSQVAANYEGTIQLTNPEYRRNREDKESASVARRSLSILRRRWISNGLAEHITVTNFSPDPEQVAIDLELDCDAADIFEVRGYDRPKRGELLPIAIRDDRASFAYKGLDGLIRRTHVAAPAADVGAAPDDPTNPGAVRFRWRQVLKPAETMSLELVVWCDTATSEDADPFAELPTIEPTSDTDRPPGLGRYDRAQDARFNELFDRLVGADDKVCTNER